MGDMGDIWRSLREQSKIHKEKTSKKNTEALETYCKNNSIQLETLTPYQLRITKGNITIDIFPKSNKYHIIKPEQKRGQFRNIIVFLSKTL